MHFAFANRHQRQLAAPASMVVCCDVGSRTIGMWTLASTQRLTEIGDQQTSFCKLGLPDSLAPGQPSVLDEYLKTVFCPAGAPLEITADLINTFNISLVVRGSVSETGRANDGDRYSVPKAQNIFRCLFALLIDDM